MSFIINYTNAVNTTIIGYYQQRIIYEIKIERSNQFFIKLYLLSFLHFCCIKSSYHTLVGIQYN